MIKRGAIFLINAYQRLVSPDQGLFRRAYPTCRFFPSCSEYTKQAIIKYGLAAGFLKGLKRIIRCHPFNPGGHDPLL